MENSIQHYYEGERYPILPYIVAPLPNLQNSIIFGSNELVKEHDSFVGSVVENFENINNIGVFARCVSYKKYLNIYITYVTECVEDKSNRKGLTTNVGCAIL